MSVLVVAGTRPEIIKLVPVVHALAHGGSMSVRFCHSGQHEELGQSVLEAAGIAPDERLLRPVAPDIGALVAGLTTSIGAALDRQRPRVVVVQGDTATALAGAMAAFHRQIPVAHVEAGLRSGHIGRPWPEEGYRRMISRIAHWHFAPTRAAAQALVEEGVDEPFVEQVGNTVIDALYWAMGRIDADDALGCGGRAPARAGGQTAVVLATVHRREHAEGDLRAIAEGLRALVAREKVELVLPLHPRAENEVLRDLLGRMPRIHIVEPLGYFAFLRVMRAARLIVSDSGGVQEEATALGRSLLVLRSETERPEALMAGTARLVGADTDLLLDEAQAALARPAPEPSQVFGDGQAARRIASRLARDLLARELASHRLILDHRLQCLDPVRFMRGLVPADAVDARETHGQARLVPLAGVDRIERDFEHQRLVGFAHRAEAVDGVLAHMPVEPFQLLVGEAEIGLADRQQFRAPIRIAVPAAEGEVGIETRPLAAAALGIHQHAVDQQRIALPLVPQARSGGPRHRANRAS